MEAFAGTGAAFYFGAVLFQIVFGAVGQWRHSYFGSDEIFHVLQREHVTLSAIGRAATGLDGSGFLRLFHPSPGAVEADDFDDFIAPEGNPATAFHDPDGINEIEHLRLPEDCFEDAACGGGRHHGITDALNFHLGAGETGKVAPGTEGNIVWFHWRKSSSGRLSITRPRSG